MIFILDDHFNDQQKIATKKLFVCGKEAHCKGQLTSL